MEGGDSEHSLSPEAVEGSEVRQAEGNLPTSLSSKKRACKPLPRLLPLHGRVHVEACDVVGLYGLKYGLPGNRGAAIR